AFNNIITRYKIPTIATHHDFFWERKEFKTPCNGFLKEYVNTYLPPRNDLIKHTVLSSIAQRELKKRRDIDSVVIPDIFDFSQDPWREDKFNQDLLGRIGVKDNDLLFLQATRIVPRKGIELAIDFASAFNKDMERLRGKTLYNGKKIDADSRLVLVLAGYYEDSDKDYYLKIKEVAQDSGVEVKFVNHHIQARRSYNNGERKFSLWDIYVYSDLVTFPSIWEGWGNQFIEAVFARKPVVVWEYPVFKEDIKQEGYQIISLGDKLLFDREEGLRRLPPEHLKGAIETAKEWLLDPDLDKVLADNFDIGEKNHGFQVVEDFLVQELGLDILDK
ncbi:MAG TPA: glycosyltransferase family 4 protein, partial [Patescibacteria group bacterium]|nr:glycosyltransferase family 4 protein [Patescibacteria group bacterium]